MPGIEAKVNSFKPPERPNYGLAILEFMNRLGASGTAVATIAGVSKSTTSRWISGTKEPGAYEIFRLLEFSLHAGIPMPRGWPHNHTIGKSNIDRWRGKREK
jgi:hypothetical protein